MADELARLRRDYGSVFVGYLTNADERALRSAYELGREAMRRSIGLLEVVRMHNETYLEEMGRARDLDGAMEVARAASAFLLELLAAFEMTQRGFMDLGLRRDNERPGGGADPPSPVR